MQGAGVAVCGPLLGLGKGLGEVEGKASGEAACTVLSGRAPRKMSVRRSQWQPVGRKVGPLPKLTRKTSGSSREIRSSSSGIQESGVGSRVTSASSPARSSMRGARLTTRGITSHANSRGEEHSLLKAGEAGKSGGGRRYHRCAWETGASSCSAFYLFQKQTDALNNETRVIPPLTAGTGPRAPRQHARFPAGCAAGTPPAVSRGPPAGWPAPTRRPAPRTCGVAWGVSS